MSSAPPPGNSSANSSSSSPPTDNKSPPAPPPSSSPPPPSPPPSNSDDDSASPPAPSKSDDGGDDPPSPPPPSNSKSKSDGDDSGHKSSPSSQKPLPPPSPPTHESSSGHKELSPPDSDRDSSSNSNRHSDINLPIMIGVVAGVGLFAVIMVTACIFCSRKKRKPHDQMIYYDDSGGFYGGGPPQHWNNGPQGMNPAVKLQPSQVPLQGGGGGGGGGGGWQPPSTLMSGSDGSSIYSGPRVPALPPPSPAIALGFNKSTFSYEELAAATSGFAPANLLGQGGFGYVHKGVLPNGKEIAVKQLKSGSGQGEREFQAEVEIISRVHHRHLVSLVGYCISGEQRMLVYEYVPNKTLEFHLYGKGLPVMDWLTRLRIALGSAKGLAYLHEDCHPRIIHRDIKAANILLDYRFEAMVADFGLAKLSTDSHTHVSTRVMGTFGYLAPEYASSGKLTEKSDVFSFGVMLLELITGRRPVGSQYAMEDSLVDWARPILSECLASRDFQELVDPRLEGNYNPEEMSRMVACAAASVRHSAKRRPRMSQIVRALEGDVSLEDLNEGAKAGNGSYFGSGSDYDSSPYNNTPRRGRRVVVASPDYSSDFGGTGGSGGFSGESQRGVGNQRQNSPPYGYDEPV